LRSEVRPRDLDRLRRLGVVSEALKPLLEVSEVELEDWIVALGGIDEISPQRRAILDDAAGLGVALRAELGRFLRTGDPAPLSLVTTLANARRAALVSVGLDPVRADPLDVEDYAKALRAQPGAGEAIDHEDVAQPETARDRDALPGEEFSFPSPGEATRAGSGDDEA